MTREATAIRDFCQRHGITQPALAKAYGCSQPAISQFLSGKRPIPDIARMIAALSEVLGKGAYMNIWVIGRENQVIEYSVTIETDDEYEHLTEEYEDTGVDADDGNDYGTCEG